MSCHVLEILAALAHEVCKVEQRKLVFFLPTLCLPFWVQIMKVGLEGRKRIYPRSLHCETPSQAQHFSISVFLLLKTLVHGVWREVVGRGTLWTCRDHPVHPYLSWTTSPLAGPVPPVRWQACWQFPCFNRSCLFQTTLERKLFTKTTAPHPNCHLWRLALVSSAHLFTLH